MILRKKLSKGFTIVPTATANDASLSYRALGILVHLLAHPDNWRVNFEALMKKMDVRSGREGRDAVLAALSELETAGYYRRQRVRGERGRFRTVGWISDVALSEAEWQAVTAFPQVAPTTGLPEVGQPEVGQPEVGQPEVGQPAPLVSTGVASTKRASTEEQELKRERAPQDRSHVEDPDLTRQQWPESPSRAQRDGAPRRIDKDGSVVDPELVQLRADRDRLKAAYDDCLSRSLDEVAGAFEAPVRTRVRAWAQAYARKPSDLVTAYLVATEAAPYHASDRALEIALDRVTTGKSSNVTRGEVYERISKCRDRLREIERRLTDAAYTVERREQQHTEARAGIRALAAVARAGGVQALTEARRAAWTLEIDGVPGCLRRLAAMLSAGRNALRQLGFAEVELVVVKAGQVIDAVGSQVQTEEAVLRQRLREEEAVARDERERRVATFDAASIVAGLDLAGDDEDQAVRVSESAEVISPQADHLEVPHVHMGMRP